MVARSPMVETSHFRSLLGWVVVVALGITAWVVVVGGIVCIKDDDYVFAEYVADLASVYKLLATAVIGAIAHAYLLEHGDEDTTAPAAWEPGSDALMTPNTLERVQLDAQTAELERARKIQRRGE